MLNPGTTLTPGSTVSLVVGCSTPPGTNDGYLVVKIDSGDVLTESDETNNIFSLFLAVIP
jgi:subtilase family serine protease